ncbi:MAG: hypothetical protein DME75_12510 [Verrucomicrobia bacterium]|nr:MAG: hypothetical protein DME75_12510 [Verrucomicrobiota bacterium]
MIGRTEKASLRLSEIASVLMRLDHVASFIVNANHSTMRHSARHTTNRQTAAHRKLDRRRADLYAGGLRKRAQKAALSI